jgi:hypothetical protein
VEVVRAGDYKEAIVYAKKHLAPKMPQHDKEVQVAMALLAFGSNTQCSKYKVGLNEFPHA